MLSLCLSNTLKIFFCLFFYLLESQKEKEIFTAQMTAMAEIMPGQSQDFHLDLLLEWQDSQRLDHGPLLFPGHYQGTGTYV